MVRYMAHIHEKIDFTTSVYIVRDNKVLLHVHKRLDIWLPPGGHVELDEDPNQSALREAKEETGLDVELVGEGRDYGKPPYLARDLILPRFLNRHYYDASQSHEHIDMAFFARATGGTVRHEVAGKQIRWFTKDELEGGAYDINPDVKFHALAALDALKTS